MQLQLSHLADVVSGDVISAAIPCAMLSLLRDEELKLSTNDARARFDVRVNVVERYEAMNASTLAYTGKSPWITIRHDGVNHFFAVGRDRSGALFIMDSAFKTGKSVTRYNDEQRAMMFWLARCSLDDEVVSYNTLAVQKQDDGVSCALFAGANCVSMARGAVMHTTSFPTDFGESTAKDGRKYIAPSLASKDKLTNLRDWVELSLAHEILLPLPRAHGRKARIAFRSKLPTIDINRASLDDCISARK